MALAVVVAMHTSTWRLDRCSNGGLDEAAVMLQAVCLYLVQMHVLATCRTCDDGNAYLELMDSDGMKKYWMSECVGDEGGWQPFSCLVQAILSDPRLDKRHGPER